MLLTVAYRWENLYFEYHQRATGTTHQDPKVSSCEANLHDGPGMALESTFMRKDPTSQRKIISGFLGLTQELYDNYFLERQ